MRQARVARTPEVAGVFRQMAAEYQEKAVGFNESEASDIDERFVDEERSEAAGR
jgi:hypothetical protein